MNIYFTIKDVIDYVKKKMNINVSYKLVRCLLIKKGNQRKGNQRKGNQRKGNQRKGNQRKGNQRKGNQKKVNQRN
jgi:hypothetical protein